MDKLDVVSLLDRALAQIEEIPPHAAQALRGLAAGESPQRAEQIKKVFEALGDG